MKPILLATLFAAALFTTSCSEKAATQPPSTIQTSLFQFRYADKTQPENVHNGGEVPQIAFTFAYQYQKIKGTDLQLNWQGKLTLSRDDTIVIQTSAPISLKIDGQTIPLNGTYTEHPLTQGEHNISVDYAPTSLAADIIVNFLPSSQQARAPESIAPDIHAKSKDIIRFANLTRDTDQDEQDDQDTDQDDPDADSSLTNTNKNLKYNGTLHIPADSNDQIIILTAFKPINAVMQPEKGANIKAIIATPSIGSISGTNAPIYRVTTLINNPYFFVSKCHCIGGIDLSCNDASYESIQTLAQTLVKKPVDYFYRSYSAQSGWLSNELTQELKHRSDQTYQKAKAQCGGKEAITFDHNALTDQGSLKANEASNQPSWFSQMNDTIPQQGFKAYYFTQDNIGKPIASEIVPHIAMNYPFNTFHNIDADKFAALWVGKITVPTDTLMDMQYDLEQADLRIRVDGKIVHERTVKDNRTNPNQPNRFDLPLSKGEHQLEVEYINHWHTVGFALIPQPKQLNTPDSKAEAESLVNNPNYTIITATVSESDIRDSSLKITLPSSSKPTVLVLNSTHLVFWQIQPSNANIKAVIIQDGKGTVQGSHAPVLRVNQLPYPRSPQQISYKFNQYNPPAITANDWKKGKN